MANTILTPTAVTREVARVLHQKLNFIGNIDRQYDDSYAKSGAKIGDSLKIRMPNKYVVRTGRTLDVQDTTESSVTLQVATQKGVDMTFTSNDLTLSLDDFSKRIIEPAASVLAANVESDALSGLVPLIYNSSWNAGAAATLAKFLAGRKILQDNLAPMSDRKALCSTQATVDMIDGLKGLFHDDKQVSRQYREGEMGRAIGFDWSENSLMPSHTRGGANTSYVCNTSTGITSGTATIAVTTGSGTFEAGDVITVGDVFRVHPETKVSTGVLQQFVVLTDSAGGSVTLDVSPTPVTSGAGQNVTLVSAGASKAVVINGTASDATDTSLLFHKEFAAFATADLVMPDGVDWKAREVVDGVSIRMIRQYDINNDAFPARLDVLYGYKLLRPELACRVQNN
jgi:hypothetical protein